ncbi:MAG TPA: DUF4326 domain-containing protein [Aeromicrobium sp.]|nr:DUF4326 domain-containing protein [Aeromicrobium sp.]HKY58355.1 DUF4326 domain-containing protein [Aeromicrobium sp.]
MTAPKRIQRKRTKGWRMPEGAVYVGRPSRWGNPFTVMNGHRQGWLVWDDRDRLGMAPGYTTSNGFIASFRTKEEAQAEAVKRYRRWIKGAAARIADLTPELAGRDLACWCPLDQPCHADVLLELANGGAS